MNITTPRQILIIGSLPPNKSAAAALGLHVAEVLADTCDIIFVIDDLAPPAPVDLPFPVLRQRELIENWASYGARPRLYVIGGEGDSLGPLELLQKAPGTVLPASLDLFGLAESFCRTTGTWPADYWHWLEAQTGTAAKTLYTARIHHRRESLMQGRDTPAFDLLLDKATAVIAPSPAAARALTASGITPSALLETLPAGAPRPVDDRPVRDVLYVSDTSFACQAVQADLGVFDAMAHMSHRTIHPAARHLSAAVEEADIVAILSGKDEACSPALALAMTHGKVVITAGQPWAAHLPKDCHLGLPHDRAVQTLTATVAAAVSDKALRQSLHRGRQAFMASSNTSLLTAVGQPALPEATVAQPATPAPVPAPQRQSTSAEPTGPVALIGAVPPPSVLQAIAPGLDLERCPRFATPALAARMGRIAHHSPASLLGQMGFEAPLIAEESATVQAHRPAQPFDTVREGLQAKSALAFACNVADAEDGTALLRNPKTRPSLHVTVGFDEQDRKAPPRGHDARSGLFWSHDTVRHSMQCILLVGAERASFTLRTVDGLAYMVASQRGSSILHGETVCRLVSDDLGLVEFRLLPLDGPTGAPLDSLALRKQLADNGLILEWS